MPSSATADAISTSRVPTSCGQASLAIDSLEKGLVLQTDYIRNRPVYDYFVIPAILLLAGALVLRAVPYFIDLT